MFLKHVCTNSNWTSQHEAAWCSLQREEWGKVGMLQLSVALVLVLNMSELLPHKQFKVKETFSVLHSPEKVMLTATWPWYFFIYLFWSLWDSFKLSEKSGGLLVSQHLDLPRDMVPNPGPHGLYVLVVFLLFCMPPSSAEAWQSLIHSDHVHKSRETTKACRIVTLEDQTWAPLS